jgi:hypothetical protein
MAVRIGSPPRVGRAHRLGAQAEPVHHAGTEVLDDHVGRLDQPPRRLAALVLLQVEHDAALAAVPDGVCRRLHARPARRVDADHVGALVGEQHRRQRPRDVLAEIDHPYAVERTRHDVPSSAMS